jgi:hypothetical protein
MLDAMHHFFPPLGCAAGSIAHSFQVCSAAFRQGTFGSVLMFSFPSPHFVPAFALFSARLALMQFGVASYLSGSDMHWVSFAARSALFAWYQSTDRTSSSILRVSQPASINPRNVLAATETMATCLFIIAPPEIGWTCGKAGRFLFTSFCPFPMRAI